MGETPYFQGILWNHHVPFNSSTDCSIWSFKGQLNFYQVYHNLKMKVPIFDKAQERFTKKFIRAAPSIINEFDINDETYYSSPVIAW